MILRRPFNPEVVMDVELSCAAGRFKRLERAEKDADRARRLRIMILESKAGRPRRCDGGGAFSSHLPALGAPLQRRRLGGSHDLRGEPRCPSRRSNKRKSRAPMDAGPTAEDEVCSLRGKDVQRILAKSSPPRRSPASITCCIAWDTRTCASPRIVRPTPRQAALFQRPGPRFGDRRRASGTNGCEFTFRTSHGLANRERQPTSGREWIPTHGRSANRVPISLGSGGRLP